MMPKLRQRNTPGATVAPHGAGAWRLSIPSGSAGTYRWAQLDDYLHLARHAFLWRPPLRVSLRARVSANNLSGTWGFGLWNDPFNASLGQGGAARRVPTAPNAAWFFYAAAPNYLALRDSHPAQGFLAATFAAPRIPLAARLLGTPLLPLLAWPPTARYLRKLARLIIREDAAQLPIDAGDWHSYTLEWTADQTRFSVDGQTHFETRVSPHAPLGLVLWIDNQYAAFPPDGKLHFGTSPTPENAWLDLADITITPP